ncbi:hypothetical protein ACQPZJ_31165 [Actinoplanes sp. CA-054009]
MQMTSLSSLASAAFNSARSTLKDMAEAAAAQSQPTTDIAATSAKPTAETAAPQSEKPTLGAIEQAVADRQATTTEPKPLKLRQGLSLDAYA